MPNRAFHAQALPDGLAEWIQLLPAGTVVTRDGRGPYMNDNPQAILEAFARWGMPMLIDYEHQSIDASEKTAPIPAAGWIHELQIRDGEIWGRVEWTPRATELLAAKEYRYISPVFEYESRTGSVTRILNAALTNNPNLYMQAAASQGGTMDELIRELCYMLNLPLTSTREEITQHLTRLIEMVQGNAEATQSMAKLLGLPETSEISTVAQAFAARLKAEPDPAKFVARDEYDRVASSLEQIQTQRKKDQAEHAVAEATRAGKITPAMKPWAIVYATSNPEGFAEYVKNAPAIAAGPTAPPGAPPPTSPDPAVDPEGAKAAAVARYKKDHPEVSDRDAVLAVGRENAELFRERR